MVEHVLAVLGMGPEASYAETNSDRYANCNIYCYTHSNRDSNYNSDSHNRDNYGVSERLNRPWTAECLDYLSSALPAQLSKSCK